MIEALLHLSVLSVAVPVAYLGVDKVRHSEDSFNNRLIEISSSVKEAFLEADLIEDEKVKIPKNWFIKEVPLLASVAGLKLHPSIFKRVNCVVLIWWSIFWCLPGLWLFRERRDRKFVASVLVATYVIFVVVAGCEIWGIHISDAWLKVLFVIVALLLTFCLYLGHSAMVLLNGLDERCNEWIESITENAESVGGLGQIKKLGKGK